MADVLAPLEDLPATTRLLMAATLRSGHHLLAESASRLSHKPSASADALWAIRRTSIDLRFLVARDGEEVFFFFVKRQLPTVRPLSARLQASVQASVAASPAETASQAPLANGRSTEQPVYRLQVPAFLVLRPSPSELAHSAPPGTTSESGILFRLGKDRPYLLGVCNPDAGMNAKVSYQPEGEPAKLLPSWRVEPFLELIEALREWIAGTRNTEQELDIELPSDPTQMSDVHVTLHWFVEGYVAMEAEKRQAASHESGSLDAALMGSVPSYQIGSYLAQIALSVDRSGRFATSAAQDLISLGMRLAVRRESGSLMARIALDPPDFLCQGTLREAFLASLRQSMPKPLCLSLGLAAEDAWSAFLNSAKDKSVVFRVARDGSTDQDAVVLRGLVSGTSRTLILRARAVVDVSVQPPTVQLSKITVLFDSNKGAEQTLDSETASYFMRLTSAFLGWLSVV